MDVIIHPHPDTIDLTDAKTPPQSPPRIVKQETNARVAPTPVAPVEDLLRHAKREPELERCIGPDCFFPPEPCPMREVSVALFAAFALGALTAGIVTWSFSKRVTD